MTDSKLAVDLGGTKIACAFVPGSGQDGQIVEKDLLRPDGKATSLEAFLDIMAGVLSGRSVSRIGLTVPGDIHDHTFVGRSPNIPWLNELDLGAAVAKRFGVEARITNDMEAAGVGEARAGLGKTYECFWLFTFSTGIGGVLMLDGKAVGKEKGGGEPGHICLMQEPNAPLCGCGRRGCWEALSSGSAINRRLEQIQGGRETLPHRDVNVVGSDDGERIRCLDRAAEAEEAWALQIYREAAYWSGHALADIVNCTGPEAIVYMGSVGIHAMRFLEPTIREVLHRRVMSATLRDIPIVPSPTILPGTTIATNALHGAVA